jgi:hypothetical protein
MDDVADRLKHRAKFTGLDSLERNANGSDCEIEFGKPKELTDRFDKNSRPIGHLISLTELKRTKTVALRIKIHRPTNDQVNQKTEPSSKTMYSLR